jgi:hypothetical protein
VQAQAQQPSVILEIGSPDCRLVKLIVDWGYNAHQRADSGSLHCTSDGSGTQVTQQPTTALSSGNSAPRAEWQQQRAGLAIREQRTQLSIERTAPCTSSSSSSSEQQRASSSEQQRAASSSEQRAAARGAQKK